MVLPSQRKKSWKVLLTITSYRRWLKKINLWYLTEWALFDKKQPSAVKKKIFACGAHFWFKITPWSPCINSVCTVFFSQETTQSHYRCHIPWKGSKVGELLSNCRHCVLPMTRDILGLFSCQHFHSFFVVLPSTLASTLWLDTRGCENHFRDRGLRFRPPAQVLLLEHASCSTGPTAAPRRVGAPGPGSPGRWHGRAGLSLLWGRCWRPEIGVWVCCAPRLSPLVWVQSVLFAI